MLQVFMPAVRAERFSPRATHLFADLQDLTISDFGISSVEALGLLKKIEEEFGVAIPPEEAEKLGSLQAVAEYIEARR